MAADGGEYSVDELHGAAYVIPTDQPESDGTLAWDKTTLVLARVSAGGVEGIGYSYTSAAAQRVIEDVLRPVVRGADALATPALWLKMRDAVRNLGATGIANHALSAVDVALWDLKAKLLGVSVIALMGSARRAVTAYGSGGFTSYSEAQLCGQLQGWAEQGFRCVKMKIGRDPRADVQRVHAVRRALGERAQLFVDANGAYTRKQALLQAQRFAEDDVAWFEEPVSSQDLPGLRLLRDRAPANMHITAGEYCYDPYDFERMLNAQAVDVIQADVTRCGGFTGFLEAAAIADAHGLPLSCHCAPALHATVACAAQRVMNLEYFHDHVRIEHMLFDGCPEPRDGALAPERSRPGLGLTLKAADAERFAVTH
jgi:L-alanine-DL-glutamate epimerase-like enolase superfamily enzyme